MPRQRSTFQYQLTYVTNADLYDTLERLKGSKLVVTGPENTKRGYEFRLRRFRDSLIQLSPTGKLNIWFRDYRYLERELQRIRKVLVPKNGQELTITLSAKDARKLLHNLRGVFWALYPSELQRKVRSQAKKAKDSLEGSIESQLAIAMPPHEATDRILVLVQTAMNRAWNRGNPNALYFLKPAGFPMKDLIAEAQWAKKRGHYLTTTDIDVLTVSKICTLSEIKERNRLKLEETKKLSPQEISALDEKELQERLDWRRTNQPWRMMTQGHARFVPF